MVSGIHPSHSIREHDVETGLQHGLGHVALLVGRLLVATIFILSGFSKITDFGGTAAHMAEKGIPATQLLLVGAIVVELGGGVLLATGLLTRWAAVALFLFLIPATLIFHNFWALEGAERLTQQTNFLKNLAIMGGLLITSVAGAGAYSLDRLLRGDLSAHAPRWRTG
ncbi:MAG: DoxX family protein [Myxococcota bacterium]